MKFEVFKWLFGHRQDRDGLLEMFELTSGQPVGLRVPLALTPAGHVQQVHRHRHRSSSRAGLPMSVH